MKKNLLLFAATTVLSTNAFANSLKCTLQSGALKDAVVMNLEAPEEFLDSNGAYDLNFQLQAECVGNECSANMTIFSGIVEDEVGQVAFDFLKTDQGDVYREELTHTPDKRRYYLTCVLIK